MTLVEESVSTETVACLVGLLDQAQRGELVGVAVGAIYKRSNFGTCSAGEARRNPVFTMGVLDILREELGHGAVHIPVRK